MIQGFTNYIFLNHQNDALDIQSANCNDAKDNRSQSSVCANCSDLGNIFVVAEIEEDI